jgi:hypothetical protein
LARNFGGGGSGVVGGGEIVIGTVASSSACGGCGRKSGRELMSWMVRTASRRCFFSSG